MLMTIIALITWLITASAGLYLLAIWLIEYDREFQTAATTRLPVPVIATHVLLAVGGLAVWALYLITDVRRLAVAAALILVAVVLLGLSMAFRWVGVYRAPDAPEPAAATTAAPARPPVPPERHFPLPVVIGHGIFAVATFTLVLLTAFGVAG
jgi:hypothetical protein